MQLKPSKNDGHSKHGKKVVAKESTFIEDSSATAVTAKGMGCDITRKNLFPA